MDNNYENEFTEKEEARVKLKSEMYNHNVENIEKRKEANSDSLMWGFVLGFAIFLIALVLIVVFVR